MIIKLTPTFRTNGQDNNLSSCLFYLHNGIEIGGFDSRVYRGTLQEGKANILFYRKRNLEKTKQNPIGCAILNEEKNTPADREDKPMLKVYCFSRCTTCKKALAWLDTHGVAHTVIDIKADHPDEEALRRYHAISGLPLKRFFNTSGIPYRELGLSKKLPEMPEDEQFRLLASDGMLVKRPLVVGEDFVLTGFKEEEWTERLLA